MEFIVFLGILYKVLEVIFPIIVIIELVSISSRINKLVEIFRKDVPEINHQVYKDIRGICNKPSTRIP